jgi:hypothetical protein
MPAHVVITREKTRDAAELEQYKQLTPPSFFPMSSASGVFTPFAAAASPPNGYLRELYRLINPVNK